MRILNQSHKSLAPLLNRLNPNFSYLYQKRFYSLIGKNGNLPLIIHTPITKIIEGQGQDFIKGLSSKLVSHLKGFKLDLKNKKVMQVRTEDIEETVEDKFGQIILISKEPIIVRYGNLGIAASLEKKPIDLLDQELNIPADYFGVIDIQKHLPFMINVIDPNNNFAFSTAKLVEVLEYEKIKNYSLNVINEMLPDDAKRLTLGWQSKIYKNPKKEHFYQEATSKIYSPTMHNRSSATLMSFEVEEQGQDNSTARHYHPGERSLYIVTTHKKAGATLNFCGVNENPEKRPDCEVKLEFPKNSLMILNFPAYTHHKFHGEFVCISHHSREGKNLIKAVQNGTLSKGFLESATVFSRSNKDEEKWELSQPSLDTRSAGSKDIGR